MARRGTGQHTDGRWHFVFSASGIVLGMQSPSTVNGQASTLGDPVFRGSWSCRSRADFLHHEFPSLNMNVERLKSIRRLSAGFQFACFVAIAMLPLRVHAADKNGANFNNTATTSAAVPEDTTAKTAPPAPIAATPGEVNSESVAAQLKQLEAADAELPDRQIDRDLSPGSRRHEVGRFATGTHRRIGSQTNCRSQSTEATQSQGIRRTGSRGKLAGRWIALDLGADARHGRTRFGNGSKRLSRPRKTKSNAVPRGESISRKRFRWPE